MSNSALGSQSIALLTLPAGTLIDYAGTVEPSGWLLCDGRAVSRTTYASLFAAISTSYGDGTLNGNGGASGFAAGAAFNLPDFRGRFARYNDNMGTANGAANRDTAARAADKSQAQGTAKNGLALSNATVASSTHWHSLPIAVSFGSSTTSWESPPNGFNGTISGQTGTSSPMGTQMTRVAATNSKLTSYSDNATTTVGLGNGDTDTRPINLSCNKLIKI